MIEALQEIREYSQAAVVEFRGLRIYTEFLVKDLISGAREVDDVSSEELEDIVKWVEKIGALQLPPILKKLNKSKGKLHKILKKVKELEEFEARGKKINKKEESKND